MIYMDNAATTRPDRECLDKAQKYILDSFYNPSALYAEGYKINLKIQEAKKRILALIPGSGSFNITFTSCGTESDNQAVFCGGKRGNVVTTMGEHSAVYNSATELKNRGIEPRFASLNADGSVNVEDLLSLVDDKTSLVSVIHVNNETGAINDIASIARKVKAKNPRTLFHADGGQAFGKIPFSLTKDIDLYSLSAHKIGAMKGTGALIKRQDLVIKPYIYGGGQEKGLRSGTENVFGIKLLQFAAEKRYAHLQDNFNAVQAVKNRIIELLDKDLFEVVSGPDSSPYILCIIAKKVRGETILHEADDKGLIIGTGSACSSNDKKRYSRVILACGIDKDRADGVLRLSFSPETTMQEAIEAANILNETVSERIRHME